MRPELAVVVAAVLGAGQGYRLEEAGDKVCTLERSTNNGDNCFYEPECENVCHDVMVEVHLFLLSLAANEPSSRSSTYLFPNFPAHCPCMSDALQS